MRLVRRLGGAVFTTVCRLVLSQGAVLAIAIVAGHATAALAECEDALKPDITKIAGRTDLKYALSNVITVDNFDRYKQSGALSALYSGFNANVSFDEFDEWRKKYTQNLNYVYSETDWISYIATRMSAINAQAYIECLQKPGLKLVPNSITDKALTITLRYRTGVNGSEAHIGNLRSPESGEGQQVPNAIAVNGEFVTSFKRNKDEDITIIAQGYTTDPSNPKALYTYTAYVTVPKDLKKDESIKPTTIVVNSVTYTSRGTAKCSPIALENVKKSCEGKMSCRFVRDFPFLCGQDPDPGEPKRFSGSFSCGGFSDQAGDGAYLTVSCAPEGLKLTAQ